MTTFEFILCAFPSKHKGIKKHLSRDPSVSVVLESDFFKKGTTELRLRGLLTRSSENVDADALRAKLQSKESEHVYVIGAYLWSTLGESFRSAKWFVVQPQHRPAFYTTTQLQSSIANVTLPYLEHIYNARIRELDLFVESGTPYTMWTSSSDETRYVKPDLNVPAWTIDIRAFDLVEDIEPLSAKDRFLGAVFLHMLADCAGHPYQCSVRALSPNASPDKPFVVDLDLCARTRGNSTTYKCAAPGQMTGATALLGIAVAGLLNGGPSVTNRVRRYIDWAKSTPPPAGMASNTKLRFKTTPKGPKPKILGIFLRDWRKRAAAMSDEATTNDALLRSLGFVALGNVEKAVKLAREDATLSSANREVCDGAEYLVRRYHQAVHQTDAALNPSDTIQKEIDNAHDLDEDAPAHKKGHYLNCIWELERASANGTSDPVGLLEEIFNRKIKKPGDFTATGAIAAALLGAKLGAVAIAKSSAARHLEKALNCPYKYTTMPPGFGSRLPRKIITEAACWFDLHNKKETAANPNKKRRLV